VELLRRQGERIVGTFSIGLIFSSSLAVIVPGVLLIMVAPG
jgi:hypothetical protein